MVLQPRGGGFALRDADVRHLRVRKDRPRDRLIAGPLFFFRGMEQVMDQDFRLVIRLVAECICR
jgi:hypothetical protein